MKCKDIRRHQYRIRLNDEELKILEYLSYRTGSTKSDVLRKALKNLYNLVRVQ